jgi:glutamyl aminopeptidase
MNYYKDLMTLPSTSGDEREVRRYMKHVMSKFPQYDIVEDRLGSLFAYKKGTHSTYKVVVAGHMDEVGMIVTHIKDNGMISIQPLGGIDPSIMLATKLDLHTEKGIVKGYIGAIPPHLKTAQGTEFESFLVDIGTASKEETLSQGVTLGTRVTFEPLYEVLTNNRVLAKAIDNRYGCGLALEMIEMLHDQELPFDLYIGATVQEEVGLRGAETVTNLIGPDVFIALDASPVQDLKGNEDIQLGKGFLLRMYDPRNTMPDYLKHYFIELAKKENIPFQYYISKGGTDAAKTLDMHQGIVSTTIGLPARYIHSPAAIMDLNDLSACKNMLHSLLLDLNERTIASLKRGEYIER